MSGAGAIDLRVPIGWLFVILGAIVAGYGVATSGDAAMYVRSGGINVNVIWGAVMLVFGVAMLLLARRAAARGTGWSEAQPSRRCRSRSPGRR